MYIRFSVQLIKNNILLFIVLLDKLNRNNIINYKLYVIHIILPIDN